MTSKLPNNSRLSHNDLVLVTGARGFIGSSITDQLLSQGFRVRATARDASQVKPMHDKIEKTFGSNRFEVCEVKDFSEAGAYNEAVKGVSGIIHAATIAFGGANLKELVESEVQAVKNLLEVCSQTPSVKSFVLCSSAIAALGPDLNKLGHRTKDMWNNETIDLASRITQDDPRIRGVAYATAKTKAERFCFEYCTQNKLNFGFSSVLPFLALGAKFNPAEGHFSSHTALNEYKEGEAGVTIFLAGGPSSFIGVQDLAKLHVIALLDPEVSHTRIWGAGGDVSAHELERIIKKHYPEQKLVDISSIPKESDFSIDIQTERRLLQKHYEKDFDELEKVVLESIEQI